MAELSKQTREAYQKRKRAQDKGISRGLFGYPNGRIHVNNVFIGVW